MSICHKPSLLSLIATTMLISSVQMAQAQTQNKTGAFSQLPQSQQPTMQQKRQLNGARTYAEKQRLKKQLLANPQQKPTTALTPGLVTKTQQRAGAARPTTGRAFGPRQRVRAESRQRGGTPAK